MSKLLSSEALWKEGGGYYTERPEDLRRQPLLPNTQRLQVRRISQLFARYADLRRGARVMEVGCGKSMWLPYLAKQFNCQVSGLDIEPYAAELARANLAGAGAEGEIFCRDAFDVEQNQDLIGTFDLIYSMGVMEHFEDASARLAVLSRYLKPAGRILTTVPNLQGLNWFLQRFASLERLHMHVVYNARRLADIHERAGFATIARGYAGFYDGYVSATDTNTPRTRHRFHDRMCWASNMAGEAWARVAGERFSPEIGWLSPHVYYVGRRVAGAGESVGGTVPVSRDTI